MKETRARCALICAMVWGLLAAATAVAEPVTPADLSPERKAELANMLADGMQAELEALKKIDHTDYPLDGQIYPARITARFDEKSNAFIFEMGRAFIPPGTEIGPGLEDQLNWLRAGVVTWLQGELTDYRMEFAFDGHDIYFYCPDSMPRPDRARLKSSGVMSPVNPFPPTDIWTPELPFPPILVQKDKVAINPGHGIYKLYGEGTLVPNYVWTTQRERFFGVLEDEITPIYAAELKRIFSERSWEVDTFFTRSTSADVHEQSTEESQRTHLWADMSAKYYIEQQYPTRPDLWDVTSEQGRDRDRRKDINSRSRYAGEMNAVGMISLHTNGGQESATGTEVFYKRGSADGESLARSISCYMKEIITSQDGYEEWVFRGVMDGGYAENSGSMPSALVEIGFHTNPNDARALQDPVFRIAAMKGVEKGYRLRATPCEPLDIVGIADASGPIGSKVPVSVNFKGHPTFPITIDIEILECPPLHSCSGGEIEAVENESPITYLFGCNAYGPAQTRVATTLIDADGVRSGTVDSTIACVANSDATRVSSPLAQGDTVIGVSD